MRSLRPPRAIATLFVLGVMMALLHRWTARGPLEGRATLAVGFLLLAAFVAGDLAQHARLPRITGYLLIGFAAGPPWLGLVRRDELDALAFVEDAAVALIALAAGEELQLATLARSRVALARLTTGAMVFPFVVVSVVMISVSPWFPLTVHHTLGDGVAVALVLGAWAAVSSPVVTIALFEELDARPAPGPGALLNVAVVQDVVIGLLFALLLAVGNALTSPGALNLAVAGVALAGVTGSVAAGAFAGFAVSRWLPVVREPWPLLVATVFVAAAAARLAQLEPVLIGLAAGFAVTNIAPLAAGRLRAEVQRAAPLATAAFFVLAGAGLRLGVLADLWPWMLLLAGLRVVSLRSGLGWAGRTSDVTPVLARDGYLGLISQGGTALALGHLARRAFPEWGVSLEALIVAMIGAHLVAGPICLRAAVARMRDITEAGQGVT